MGLKDTLHKRAAKHQKNTRQVRGLSEWLKLRIPNKYVQPVNTLNHRPSTTTPPTPQAAATPRTGVVQTVTRAVRRLFDF